MKRIESIFDFLFDIVQIFKTLVYYLIKGKRKITFSGAVNESDIHILGNGPSLKSFLEKDKNDIRGSLCTVNFSLNTDMFFELKPKYHVIMDPIFFMHKERDDVKLFYNNINRIDWEFYLVLSARVKIEWIDDLTKNKWVHIIWLPEVSFMPKSHCFRRIAFTLYKNNIIAIPSINVVLGALNFSVNSGFKNIYLHGVEHSWVKFIHINNNRELCLLDSHFYDSPEKARVWTKGVGQESYKMYELLESQAQLFKSYMLVRDYCKHLGSVQVYNCTKNSLIDAFEFKIDNNI